MGEGDFDTWDQVAAGSSLEFAPHIALFTIALVRLCNGEIRIYDGLKCEVYFTCIRIESIDNLTSLRGVFCNIL